MRIDHFDCKTAVLLEHFETFREAYIAHQEMLYEISGLLGSLPRELSARLPELRNWNGRPIDKYAFEFWPNERTARNPAPGSWLVCPRAKRGHVAIEVSFAPVSRPESYSGSEMLYVGLYVPDEPGLREFSRRVQFIARSLRPAPELWQQNSDTLESYPFWWTLLCLPECVVEGRVDSDALVGKIAGKVKLIMSIKANIDHLLQQPEVYLTSIRASRKRR